MALTGDQNEIIEGTEPRDRDQSNDQVGVSQTVINELNKKWAEFLIPLIDMVHSLLSAKRMVKLFPITRDVFDDP